MDKSGFAAKYLRVDSPDPSKGDCKDGNTLEQQVFNQLLPKIIMAWHPTEVILHPEPVETGDAQEQVPTLQMEAEVTEKTKNISMQELLIQEAWCRWEESLRMAHRMQRV